MGSDAALLARLADQLSTALAALDRIERNQSDPGEVRQAIADITAAYVLIVQLAELAGVQRTEILEIVQWMHARMSGEQLQREFDDVLFHTRQLVSVLQGYRDEMLLMRKDLRELRAAIELAIGQLPSEAGDGSTPE